MLVVLDHRIEPLSALLQLQEGVRKAGHDLEIHADAPDRCLDADVLFLTRGPDDAVSALKNVRWVHTWSIGTEKLVRAGLVRPGVRCTNGQDVPTQAVAEHAISLLLAQSRQLHFFATKQHERVWSPQRDLLSLADLSVVVCGYGRIGQRVEELLRAFRCNVMIAASTRHASSDDGREPLKELIGRADVLILCLPGGIAAPVIDAELLLSAKPHLHLINVGRAHAVDLPSVLVALEDGRLRHYSTDVLDQEPPDAGDRVWLHPGLTFTPHVAWRSGSFTRRSVEYFLTLLDGCQ